jgi:hypothetical protein
MSMNRLYEHPMFDNKSSSIVVDHVHIDKILGKHEHIAPTIEYLIPMK